MGKETIEISLEYRKNLLNELRLVPYIPGTDEAEPDRESIAKAVTLNENLLSLGLTLTPAGIIQLAKSPSVDTLYDEVAACIGTVDAAPMYPDFPTQVMGLDEAAFRFHQILHYLSTYGVEAITGMKTVKGWLPEIPATEKTEKDDRLLQARAVELTAADNEDAIYLAPLKAVLGKKERMTVPEKEIVRYAAQNIPAAKLEGLEIPFKQNIMEVFHIIMDALPPVDALPVLHPLCQHTGDVLKCIDFCLAKNHYHFRTSQKKLLVKLLESYPAKDFQANLILSRKKGERSVLVLQFLDYNEYSRSPLHKEAVRKLRNGELKSWEAQAKYLLSTGDAGALDYIAQRPGMLLRMAAWLLRLGHAEGDICQKLVQSADGLSMETLVTVLTKLGTESCKNTEKEAAGRVFRKVLEAKMGILDTPLKGKKVFLSMDGYDLGHSEVRFNDRSEEGGYIRSGLAYKIPDGVKRLRFFVYWNDRERVDVDLHAFGVDMEGNQLHIGWNDRFLDKGVIFSGDITHSNAAEYIDIDLDGDAKEVATNIHLYSGKPSFGKIGTCFVGLMAVAKIGAAVELYDPANCFFSHELKGNSRSLRYGRIFTKERFLSFEGSAVETWGDGWDNGLPSSFSLEAYLDMLLKAQGCVAAENAEDADAVLVMGKASGDKEVSLIDSHFFTGF